MTGWVSESNGQGIYFAFNIWDINSAKAVIDEAARHRKDIILQTSASLYPSLMHKQIRQFISSYSHDVDIRVWLHLDHCRNPDMIKNAVDNGWDSVMIDASSMTVEDNVRITNEVTEYAHRHSVSVEAEVGCISGTEDGTIEADATIAKTQDIKYFIERTDIDLIAVAFGNAHGSYHTQPVFHYDLVEYTTNITDSWFVVHGGSGIPSNVLHRLINIKGVRKINISTDIKKAYRTGLMRAVEDGTTEGLTFQPVNVEKYIHDAIGAVVASKLEVLEDGYA